MKHHSKNGQPRTAHLSAETTRLLAQQRERVVALDRQLGRVLPDVFAHIGKGPLQGRRQREFNKAWRSACRKAGYTGTLLHDLRRSGVRAMVRSGTPGEQDLKEARDRRAQFGHNQAAKVVSLNRQVANT